MNNKKNKIILGTITSMAALAPLIGLIACSEASDPIIEISDKENLWDNPQKPGTNFTNGELNSILKQKDNAAASPQFLTQIKYEVSEELYNKEQIASIDYQKAFLKWKIYLLKKDLLEKSKNLIQLKDNTSVDDSKTFDELKKLADDLTLDQIIEANKEIFKTSQTTFKDLEKQLDKEKEKLAQLDNVSNSLYDSSTFASDYPQILRPINKIKETQQRVYNEAKSSFIDSYNTKPNGISEWAKERASKYNGASSDEEAVKYLVNSTIQAIAFGKYQYKLNESFTLEQFLAVDENNKHIFSWFENEKIGDKDTDISSSSATKDQNIFTNDISKFLDSNKNLVGLIDINTLKIKDVNDSSKWTNFSADQKSFFANKVYFLGRSTKISNDLVVNMRQEEGLKDGHFQTINKPVLMSHGLLAVKPDTKGSTLPWAVTKDTLKNLLSFYGSGSNGEAVLESSSAAQGLQLLDNLFLSDLAGSTTNKDETNLFLEYVSDDKASRETKGELGVSTLQGYSSSKDDGGLGFNDEFVLSTLVSYASMSKPINNVDVSHLVSSAIATANVGSDTPGISKIHELQKEIWDAIPLSVKNQIFESNGTTIKSGMTTSEANRIINQYITALTDDELKNKFGTIFTLIFRERKLSYKIADGVFLIVSHDSGIHIVKIEDSEPTWSNKLFVDLKEIAKTKLLTKAKVSWEKIYKTIFSNESIVLDVLKNNSFAEKINKIQETNFDLYKQWYDNKFLELAPKQKDSQGHELSDLTSINGLDISNDENKKYLVRLDVVESIKRSIDAIRRTSFSKAAESILGKTFETALLKPLDDKFIDQTLNVADIYDALFVKLSESSEFTSTNNPAISSVSHSLVMGGGNS